MADLQAICRAQLSWLKSHRRVPADEENLLPFGSEYIRVDHKSAMALCEDVSKLIQQFEHLSSEYNFNQDRGDHLVYAREWQAFDKWQRETHSREAEQKREREGLNDENAGFL